MSDATWNLVSAKQPGIVHARSSVQLKKNRSAIVAFCGIVAVPRTFGDGETVQGCAACIERGAPRRLAS